MAVCVGKTDNAFFFDRIFQQQQLLIDVVILPGNAQIHRDNSVPGRVDALHLCQCLLQAFAGVGARHSSQGSDDPIVLVTRRNLFLQHEAVHDLIAAVHPAERLDWDACLI